MSGACACGERADLMTIAGLILAGGRATRMGGVDKPLLPLGDTTLIAHLLERLRPQVACLAVSANGDPARYAHLGLPVLADERAEQGPLGGIARGLAWAEAAGADALLSVPGDTPFVPPDLSRRLHPAPAVASSGGRLHHAVALWPVAARADLERWLRTQARYSVFAFAATLGPRVENWDAAPFDPFFNINTPEDLRQARSCLPGPEPAPG